jgi:hypothetical protein
MKTKLAVAAVVMALAFTTPVLAANPKDALALPIGGTFTDAAGVGSFSGTFYLREFAVENNALVAKGILSGTLTSATGTALGSVFKPISMPVGLRSGDAATGRSRLAAVTNAVCPILHLDLGPLNLDLLGLNVNLAQVVLDITAETGAGNLLGNLLCAVTNLLNGAGALIDIANLLNQILDILTGLLG